MPATNDDIYALLQTVNAAVARNRFYLESIGIMLADVAPFAAFGNKWFVAQFPMGNDNNAGTFEAPFATIAKAKSMAVDGGFDTIFCYPSPNGAPYNEQVTLDKAGLMLVGSGGYCLLDPGPGATGPTVLVTSPNCVISGFEQIIGRNGHNAVHGIGAHFIKMERGICKTDGAPDVDAVLIEESSSPVIGPNLSCSHSGRHGLVIRASVINCHWTRIFGITAHENAGDGLRLEGSNVEHSVVHGNFIFGNTGYGIYTEGNGNLIAENEVHNNTAGSYRDVGTDNIIDAGSATALAIITGVKNLGVDVSTSFGPITMERGAKRMIVYEMTDAGVPVDCSGFTFLLAVKGRSSDAAYKIGPISGVVSLGSTGLQSLVTFSFDPNVTKVLNPFTGTYSAVLIDSSGKHVPLTKPGGEAFALRESVIDVA
jgi:hypothetical protein